MKDIAQVVELMESYGELAVKLIEYFCGDVEEAVRYLNDKYLGVFELVAGFTPGGDLSESLNLSELSST